MLNFTFFFNNILLGVGLAMDAFSVSLANGLNEPGMKKSKITGVAGLFAVFQGMMPLIGWICVHTIVQYFSWFEKGNSVRNIHSFAFGFFFIRVDKNKF